MTTFESRLSPRSPLNVAEGCATQQVLQQLTDCL